MKTILLLIICSTVISISTAFAQNQDQPKPKQDQSALFNDIYLGYGAGGLFYWTGRMKHNSGYPSETNSYTDPQTFTEPSSAGALLLGYSRTLNRVASLGFLFGLQDFTYTGTAVQAGQTNYSDILLSGLARITFCYLNKPAIHMYSGIGIGITVNFGKATQTGKEFTDRKLWPGGQLTLMGLRFGRAFGGFFEFGFGTLGIVNAGISYKFAD